MVGLSFALSLFLRFGARLGGVVRLVRLVIH